MLIVLLDEPGLFVFSSAECATREIEPFDAQSEIRAMFDESAVPYRVEWLKPVRRKIFFGLLESGEPGEYRLVPAGPPDPPALLALLEAHSSHTHPPEASGAVRLLLEELRSGAVRS